MASPPKPAPATGGAAPRTLATDLLKSLQNDPDLNDVTLIGTDSVSLTANKSILSARSDVFRRMFFGDFAEGRVVRDAAAAEGGAAINLGFGSDVLAMIVEWCYSDSLSVMTRSGGTTTTAPPTEVTEGQTRSVVRAASAADYFALEEMELRATEWVVATVHDHPSLACAVLDEAHGGPTAGVSASSSNDVPSSSAGSSSCEMYSAAWEVIRLRSKEALSSRSRTSGRGVLALGPDAIESVIDDHTTTANELTMFQCLERWAADAPDERVPLSPRQLKSKLQVVGEGGRGQQQLLEDRTQSRRDHAVYLARKINLSQILPSDLHDIVEPSDLVSSDRITAAYREQALLAESNGTFAGDVPLSQPRWGFGATEAYFREQSSALVSGAGLVDVDGVYEVRGWFNDAPKYCRVGTWEGREEIFTLVKLADEEDREEDRWYLAIAHVGKRPVKEQNLWIYLYVSPGTPAEQKILFPGGNRWEPASGGQGPGPVVAWQSQEV